MDIFNAIKQNNMQFVKAIINRDPSVIHHKNNFHETPLHWTCELGRKEIAQLLIHAGADVHVKDQNDLTPLHYACNRGHTDVVQLLIDAGADVRVKDKYGWTPLHYACNHGHADVAQLLIDAGADVHAKTMVGWTPLHEACFYGFKDLVQLFIGASTNVDWLAVNNNGQTPIDSAIDHNETEFLYFVEGFIDQLPPPEQQKLRAWRFREELSKTS